MWLFTQHGFYSVVADESNRKFVFVRARNDKHLWNLKDRFDLQNKIVYTPERDYACRLRMKRGQWISLATAMADDVRYTNYKTAAEKNVHRVGHEFVSLLHRTWDAVYRALQERLDRRVA